MNRIIVLSTMILILLLGSCATAGAAAQWTTDYETGFQIAATEKKAVLLFFSGNQWDAPSKALKETIFDSNSFLKKISSSCVLVNVDLPQNIEEIPAEQQQMLKEQIVQYNVQGLPSVFLVNAQQEPFAVLEYDETITVSKYLKNVNTAIKNEASRAKLKTQIEKANGLQKVKLIDKLYELTEVQFRDRLMDYAREVVQLDPDNKSGNLGKYELMLLYEQAEIFFSMGERDGAVKLFTDLCESGRLKPAQLQEAYYMAGYLSMIMATTPDPSVIEYFQKSYDADPKSKMAEGIKANIDYLAVQFAQYNQALSQMAEEPAADEPASESAK